MCIAPPLSHAQVRRGETYVRSTLLKLQIFSRLQSSSRDHLIKPLNPRYFVDSSTSLETLSSPQLRLELLKSNLKRGKPYNYRCFDLNIGQKYCPFGSGLRKFALDLVVFSAFLKKNTRGGLILYFNFLQKIFM